MASDMISSVVSASGVSASLSIFNYLVYEQSADSGQPEELYLLNNSSIEYWSFTGTDIDVVYDGRTYTAVLICRGDIQLSANSLKNQIELEVSLNNSFVRNYILGPVEGIVQLTIYRRHRVSNDWMVYWKGYVRRVQFKSNRAIISAGLKSGSLKRFGLMRKYSRNCGLILFSTWCGVSDTDNNYKIEGAISSVDGITITADIFGTKANGWLKGGKLKTDSGNCLQRIVYHYETTIKITRAISGLTVGELFTAWAGCDHLKATCKDKFNNKLNFGGQPHLPDKNPFIGDGIM